MSTTLVIGTRASSLALRQAEIVAGLLRAANPGIEFRLNPMTTRADRLTDRPISAIGDKGVFVRPIQDALLRGEIDIAVHSLKDVPADTEVSGLVLAAFPERADPRDVFVSDEYDSLDRLPTGARIGTSSPRRRWLVQLHYPNCEVVPIRGNVETRLRKLDAGEFDGLLLAAAGLLRLGLDHRIRQYLDPRRFKPDAGQGVLAVETREFGAGREAASRIDDPKVRAAALAERAVVRRMGAYCDSPVGAYAVFHGESLQLEAAAAAPGRPEGVSLWISMHHSDAESMGEILGARMLDAIHGDAGAS